jgi:excisionase family DNA binding protein
MAKRRGDQNPDLLTVAQVAEYLQLNRMTVYKYIREGRIPASRIGKSYRVRRQDLEAFLEAARLLPRAPGREILQPSPKREHQGVIRVQPPRGTAPPADPLPAVAEPMPDRPTPEEITGHPLERILRGLH